MILLFAAGFETTTNLIGNGLWLLMTHPAEFARLRGNPALLADDEKIINRMMVGVFSAVNIESIRQSRLKDLRESATALIAMIETRR